MNKRLKQLKDEAVIGWKIGRHYGKLAKQRCQAIKRDAKSNMLVDIRCAVYNYRSQL